MKQFSFLIRSISLAEKPVQY